MHLGEAAQGMIAQYPSRDTEVNLLEVFIACFQKAYFTLGRKICFQGSGLAVVLMIYGTCALLQVLWRYQMGG
jgi:hypothetical protein